MASDRLALLALHFIPGIGPYLLKQLVSYCGSAENVFRTPKGKLLRIPGVGKITAQAIQKEAAHALAEKNLERAEKEDVKIIFYFEKSFPSRLKQIPDSPTCLFVKGNVNFENPKSIGIVGTRMATAYGKQCIEEFIEGLIPHNPLIVSGLAYGIDIQAHKQALRCNLQTIGIMGSGMDIIYPSSHAPIAKKMMDHGGLVTENPFGTKPEAHLFPERNRIIAGLSDALIVVEAAEKGGALITADLANGYNKDVFAFPGNIGQRFSMGCNHLIKSNKAHLITTVRDLEYIMNWDLSKKNSHPQPTIHWETFEPNEQLVLKTLMENQDTLEIDVLSWKTNIPIGQLASVLLALECKGKVKNLPGKIFKIIPNA